jgi:D-alanyl-D-alanine dipeptidase
MKRVSNFALLLLLLLWTAVAAAQAPEPEPEPEPEPIIQIGPAPEAVEKPPVPAAPAVAPAPAVPAAPGVVQATAPAAPKSLVVIRDFDSYLRLAEANPEHEFIDVSTLGIPVDVRYATDGNFMRKKLYPVAKVYLRAPVARALAAANRELNATGRTLVVWDGYRPHRVTVEMWEKIRNPDYVADPAQGSRHNRGAAVDVTMRSLDPRYILRMGSNYDDFSERAAHAFQRLNPELIANRKMLRELMAKHGFDAFPSEWWHYDFRGWEKFDVMDIGLDELAAKKK